MAVLSNIEARFKGTRLDGEKEFYEEYFGGSLRAQNVMVSAADGSNAATTLGLDAMVEVWSQAQVDNISYMTDFQYNVRH